MLKPKDGILTLSCKEDESCRAAVIRTLNEHQVPAETIEDALRKFDTAVATGYDEFMAAIESVHWIKFHS